MVVSNKTGNGHVGSVQSERSGDLIENGGGRYAGNDSAVRQTYSGMIAGDIVQQDGRDSSPPRHEFRRDSNPPARSRMALHSFTLNCFAVE